MELALLTYTLIGCGAIILLVAAFIFFRLTNWLVWLKGNVPVLVGAIGVWLALIGWSLTPYVSVSATHGVMNASVVKLTDRDFKLVIDDGVKSYELVGKGDHFQTKITLVSPNGFWTMLGFPKLVVLNSMLIETNQFEQSVLSDERDEWLRPESAAGDFHPAGFEHQEVLSRQLPLASGALYSLVLQQDRLVWIAANEEAKRVAGF